MYGISDVSTGNIAIIFWGINVPSLVCVCGRFGETVPVCVYTDDGVADWP